MVDCEEERADSGDGKPLRLILVGAVDSRMSKDKIFVEEHSL